MKIGLLSVFFCLFWFFSFFSFLLVTQKMWQPWPESIYRKRTFISLFLYVMTMMIKAQPLLLLSCSTKDSHVFWEGPRPQEINAPLDHAGGPILRGRGPQFGHLIKESLEKNWPDSMYLCTCVPMHLCTYAPTMYLCTYYVPMHLLCTYAPTMYLCSYATTHLRTCVPVYLCTMYYVLCTMYYVLCTMAAMCTYVYLYLYLCTT